jgi:hypothetical protein
MVYCKTFEFWVLRNPAEYLVSGLTGYPVSGFWLAGYPVHPYSQPLLGKIPDIADFSYRSLKWSERKNNYLYVIKNKFLLGQVPDVTLYSDGVFYRLRGELGILKKKHLGIQKGRLSIST